MESELIKMLASLGGGFVLSAIILYLWRIDRAKSEQVVAQLGNDFRETVEANTAAMTKLCTLVEQMIPPCDTCPLNHLQQKQQPPFNQPHAVRIRPKQGN